MPMRTTIHLGPVTLRAASFLLLAMAAVGCQEKRCIDLRPEEIAEIKKEITERVDAYLVSAQALDLEKVFDFWSDSEGFVFAGDGSILGGSDVWRKSLEQWAASTDQYLYWRVSNSRIEVLSRNAASFTTDFETRRIAVSGDTLNTDGSWTYVFKKYPDAWRVIHSNGTHVNY